MLGHKLRSWRRFRALAVHQLAERAGISTSLLDSYEAGDAQADSAVLFELLSVLDVGLHELLTSPGPAQRRGQPIAQMRPVEDDSPPTPREPQSN